MRVWERKELDLAAFPGYVRVREYSPTSPLSNFLPLWQVDFEDADVGLEPGNLIGLAAAVVVTIISRAAADGVATNTAKAASTAAAAATAETPSMLTDEADIIFLFVTVRYTVRGHSQKFLFSTKRCRAADDKQYSIYSL